MERIQELFQLAIEQCIRQEIPLGNFESEVAINPRARRRWGACKTIGYTSLLEKRKPIYRIELSKHLAENGSDQDILNTLIHELLHTCKGCMNHGKLWHYHATKMNCAYGYHVKPTASSEEMESEELHVEKRKENYKYEVRCNGCGATVYRMKKSNLVEHPEQYLCRKCGGGFSVVQLP